MFLIILFFHFIQTTGFVCWNDYFVGTLYLFDVVCQLFLKGVTDITKFNIYSQLSSKPINSSIVCGYFRDFSPYVSFLLLTSFPRNCCAFQRILFKTLSTFDLFLSWTWYILVGIVCAESFHDRSFNKKVLTLIGAST